MPGLSHNLSLEEQLASKLETYQGVRREFYMQRRRLEYLGGWLLQMSGELGMLRYEIGQQQRHQQLEVFDKDLYYENQLSTEPSV